MALKRYLASGLSGLVVLLLVCAFGAGSVMAAQDCKRPAGGKVHLGVIRKRWKRVPLRWRAEIDLSYSIIAEKLSGKRAGPLGGGRV